MCCDSETVYIFMLLLLGTSLLTEGFPKGKDFANRCGVDVCAGNIAGLKCPKGSSIHILQVVCSSADGECPHETNNAMHLCDGLQNCRTSSFRGQLSKQCEDTDETKRNIVVEYSCLQGYKSGEDPKLASSLPCGSSSVSNVTNVPLPSRITQKPSGNLPPAVHNYGPGDAKQENSSSLSKKLKLIIIYVFFGVIILVLAVALIAVIISYHRLSKKGSSSGSSSEKTALWHQQDETPLDTFQQNSMAECSGSITSETNYPYTVASDSDKVVATVHHDAISENEEFNHRLSSGSGISTFLSGKRDNDFRDLINTFQTGSFAVYDDVSPTDTTEADFYQMPSHEIFERDDSLNIYEVIDKDQQNNASNKNSKVFANSYSPVPNHDTEANDSEPFVDYTTDDCHYSVNNDEYAIVQKSRKQVQEASMSGDYEPLFDNSEVVDFRPTSGPYEKIRNTNKELNTRWSKGGERWTDDY